MLLIYSLTSIMKKIFLTAIVILALSAPMFVSAQGLKDAGKILDKAADPSKTGLSGDLSGTIAAVIKAVLALVGTIFLVLTIYAGILWMTASGNEDQITKAVGIIKASIVGLIVIMSAYAITSFVTSKLVGVAGTSNQTTGQTTSSGTDCSSAINQTDCQIISDTYKTKNGYGCLWSADGKCIPW
jgi:hypothetical protein